MLKSFVLFIFCAIFLFDCHNGPRNIEPIRQNGLLKTPLGKSGYYVKHPNDMPLSVDEWHRSGDDSAFAFSKINSLPPYGNTFFIGLNASHSDHLISFDFPVIEVVQSAVLGGTVKWNVRKGDKGFFVVDTRLKNMQLVGTSSTKSGIDSMVALMSTLSSR